MMLVVVKARPAEATFEGSPGKIAYEGFDGSDWEIYTIDPTGGSPSKSPTTLRATTILSGEAPNPKPYILCRAPDHVRRTRRANMLLS
jgi:hypothetical protein